jgi:hypothetical protein
MNESAGVTCGFSLSDFQYRILHGIPDAAGFGVVNRF